VVVHLRTSEILAGIEQKAKEMELKPPVERTIKNYIREFYEEGILERKGQGLYRPSDYFYEYSKGVPLYLIEKSSNFLSIPLSPYVWMGISNFPAVDEMDPSEIPMTFYGLSMVAVGLQILHGVRSRTVKRLERETLETRKDDIRKTVDRFLSRIEEVGGLEKLSEMDESSSKLKELESIATDSFEQNRIMSLTEWRERYLEEPLVVSGVFLSQIFKTVAFERKGKPELVNFQIYSFFRRLLQFSRELWESEKASGRISESEADENMKNLGLTDEYFEETVATLCKEEVRRLVDIQLVDLKRKEKRLESLLERLERQSKSQRRDYSKILGEAYGITMSNLLYGPREDDLKSLYTDFFRSEGLEGFSRSKFFVRNVINSGRGWLIERMGKLEELDETIYRAESPEEVRVKTMAFPPPLFASERSGRCDHLALAKQYFPPDLKPPDIPIDAADSQC